jgi:hypothetical protein
VDGPTLGHSYVARARLSHFLNRCLHLLRRHPLPLLHVHSSPCPTGCDKKVRLPTQERRDL